MRRGRQIAAVAAARAIEILRCLALIGPACGQAARQLLGRVVGVIGVIAGILVGQQHVQHVVTVIVPLRIDIASQMRRLVMVLQHQMHLAARVHAAPHGRGHLLNPALVLDRVHRVEAQPIEPVLHQPGQHIAGEIAAHFRAMEVDRRSPRGLLVLSEELRRVAVQVISIGAEMIIHHVEKDHQAEPVGGIDQRLQLVRRAIGAVRGVGQHAVVTPVVSAGEIIDRHQLDRRDAKLLQPRQSLGDTGKSAHRADMQLIQHGFAPWPPTPIPVPPHITSRIHHHARPVHIIRLKPRGGIGHQHAIRQPIPVARARPACRVHAEPTVRRALHRQDRAILDRHRHLFLRRRPNAEARAPVGQQDRTKWQVVRVEVGHSTVSGCLAQSSTALRAATNTEDPCTLPRSVPVALSTRTCAVPAGAGRRNRRSSAVGIQQQREDRHSSVSIGRRTAQDQRPLLGIVPSGGRDCRPMVIKPCDVADLRQRFGGAMQKTGAAQHRMRLAECDKSRDIRGERRIVRPGRGVPVEPGDAIVLAIGVVVAALGHAELVAGQQHRRAGSEEHRGQHGPPQPIPRRDWIAGSWVAPSTPQLAEKFSGWPSRLSSPFASLCRAA